MFLKMDAMLHNLHVRSPKKHLYIRLCHTSKWNMEIKFNLRTRDPLVLSPNVHVDDVYVWSRYRDDDDSSEMNIHCNYTASHGRHASATTGAADENDSFHE